MFITEFKQLIKKKQIVLGYFSASHCNVCKVIRPQIEELVERFKEIEFLYIDTEQNKEICGQYSVFAIPTIIIFIEGKESKRLSRNFSLSGLYDFLSRMIKLMKN